jgi:hypothetical protein
MLKFIRYSKILEQIPPYVEEHLHDLIKSCGLTDNKRTFKRAAESWVAKRGIFDRIIEHGNFQRTNLYSQNEPNACIAMTLSGSLITLGPLENNGRTVTYASIGMRTDVPEMREEIDCQLDGDLALQKNLFFKKGPIKATSTIIDIAIIPGNDDINTQKKRLNAANKILLSRFVDINRDFFSDKSEDEIDNRNDLFEKWIILEWFRIGGVDEFVFYGRSKVLWLELFTDLYNFLTKKHSSKEKRDELFMDLQNTRFGKFIDVYKWIESENKDFDIGLMKALEEIPELEKYKKFCDDYVAEFK